MQIRKAEVIDFAIMSKFSIETYERLVLQDYSEQGKRLAIGYLEEDQFRRRRLEDYHWFVITDQYGTLRGFAEIRGMSHISVFVIFEGASGSGYGRGLMEFVLTFLHQTGYEQVSLKASRYALDFYKKMGFLATGPEEDTHGIVATPMIYMF